MIDQNQLIRNTCLNEGTDSMFDDNQNIHLGQAQLRKMLVRRYSSLAVCLCSLIIFTACGHARNSDTPMGSGPILLVTFTPSTTYTAAIATITDIGVRHTLPCRNSVAYPSGTPGPWIRWWSVNEQSNWNDDAPRTLWVTPTVLAPADWQKRLQAFPIVTRISGSDNLSCPVHLADAEPTPGTLYYLPAQQVGTYARITFRSTATYEDALTALDNLGVRLAAPCREQEQMSGTAGAWAPVGQEAAFAHSGSLVIATTDDTSNQWQDQVHTLPDVMAIEVPYSVACK